MRIIEKGDGIKKGSFHEIIQGNNDTCWGGNDVGGGSIGIIGGFV